MTRRSFLSEEEGRRLVASNQPRGIFHRSGLFELTFAGDESKSNHDNTPSQCKGALLGAKGRREQQKCGRYSFHS